MGLLRALYLLPQGFPLRPCPWPGAVSAGGPSSPAPPEPEEHLPQALWDRDREVAYPGLHLAALFPVISEYQGQGGGSWISRWGTSDVSQ